MNIRSTQSSFSSGYGSSSSWGGTSGWDDGSYAAQGSSYTPIEQQDRVQLSSLDRIERGAQGLGFGALYGGGNAAAVGAVLLGLDAMASVAMGEGFAPWQISRTLRRLGTMTAVGACYGGLLSGAVNASGANLQETRPFAANVGRIVAVGASIQSIL